MSGRGGLFLLKPLVEVDLAFYGGLAEEYPETIRSEELFRDELWFVVAPDHRYAGRQVSLAEMVREPFVMRETGSSTRERFLALCRTFNAPAPRIALQFNGLNETVQAVIAGYGASFVSSLVVREQVERGRLSRVFVDGPEPQNIFPSACAKTSRCLRRRRLLSGSFGKIHTDER